MITFSQIPANLLTPGAFVEFDTNQMQNGLPTARTRTLICGQKLAAGTAVANTLLRVTSANHAKQLYGVGSMLANMIKAYIDNDPTTEVFAIGMTDNAGGVAASATLTFGGAVTAAGTVALLVEDKYIQVAVTAAQSLASIATAVAAAINAVDDLSVTAAAAAAVVTLTARHKGIEGNYLSLDYNYHPGDVTPTGLTITPTAFANGAGNPDASAVITAIGDEAFSAIVTPWTDSANLTVFEAALADRAGALKMNYGEAYSFRSDSYGNLTTLGNARNSPYAAIGGLKAVPTAPWSVAAAMAAQVSFSARNDPGQPFNTLVLKNVLPPRSTNRLTRQERQFLLEAGISTFVVTPAGEVAIERMVTTYKSNAQGVDDVGLKDLNSILLLYYLSWSLQNRLATQFPRYKLGNDTMTYAPGQKVATPRTIKAEIVALASLWAEAALIEDLEGFIAALVVERDATDRSRVNVRIRPDLINGLQVTAALIQPVL